MPSRDQFTAVPFHPKHGAGRRRPAVPTEPPFLAYCAGLAGVGGAPPPNIPKWAEDRIFRESFLIHVDGAEHRRENRRLRRLGVRRGVGRRPDPWTTTPSRWSGLPGRRSARP